MQEPRPIIGPLRVADHHHVEGMPRFHLEGTGRIAAGHHTLRALSVHPGLEGRQDLLGVRPPVSFHRSHPLPSAKKLLDAIPRLCEGREGLTIDLEQIKDRQVQPLEFRLALGLARHPGNVVHPRPGLVPAPHPQLAGNERLPYLRPPSGGSAASCRTGNPTRTVPPGLSRQAVPSFQTSTLNSPSILRLI